MQLTLDIRIKKLDGRRMLISPDGKDLILPSKPEPKRYIVDERRAIADVARSLSRLIALPLADHDKTALLP